MEPDQLLEQAEQISEEHARMRDALTGKQIEEQLELLSAMERKHESLTRRQEKAKAHSLPSATPARYSSRMIADHLAIYNMRLAGDHYDQAKGMREKYEAMLNRHAEQSAALEKKIIDQMASGGDRVSFSVIASFHPVPISPEVASLHSLPRHPDAQQQVISHYSAPVLASRPGHS
ncbi:hypothetical protein [Streptomyces rishiriensis]|nr:hypothetical protein [Streptomyces rishiriensis]